jgi:hypothetical protein
MSTVFFRFSSSVPAVPFVRALHWFQAPQRVPETVEQLKTTSGGGGGGARSAPGTAPPGAVRPTAPLPPERPCRRPRPRTMSHAEFLRCMVTNGFVPPRLVGTVDLDVVLTSCFLAAVPPTDAAVTPSEGLPARAVTAGGTPAPDPRMALASAGDGGARALDDVGAAVASVAGTPAAAAEAAPATAGVGVGGRAAPSAAVVTRVRVEPARAAYNYGHMTRGMEARLRRRFRALVYSDGAEDGGDAAAGEGALDGAGRDGGGGGGGGGSAATRPSRSSSMESEIGASVGSVDSVDGLAEDAAAAATAGGARGSRRGSRRGSATQGGGRGRGRSSLRLRLSHALDCMGVIGRVVGDTLLHIVLRLRGLTLLDFVDEAAFVDTVTAVLALRYRLLSVSLTEPQFVMAVAMAAIKGA